MVVSGGGRIGKVAALIAVILRVTLVSRSLRLRSVWRKVRIGSVLQLDLIDSVSVHVGIPPPIEFAAFDIHSHAYFVTFGNLELIHAIAE